MSSVHIVAVTVPFTKEATHAEEFIAYCARVSNPANQANIETAPKLINYMVKNQHWSPFEMAHAVMEITTTRDIARQILRHRSFSFQEFSQRYAAVVEPPVIRETRLQDTKNRQSSLATEDEDLQAWWEHQQQAIADETVHAYQTALAKGIAKEVARAVLPEGLTASRLYMAGTIRSWIHYIQLRSSNGTQKEHREIAVACRDQLLIHLPTLQEVLNGQREH